MIEAKKVQDILIDCLYDEDEIIDGKPIIEPVYVLGVIDNLGFHPERLESHRQEVQSMVDQLPYTFTVSDSFVNMCIDKNGNQWGEHRNCDQLLTLAVGLGIMEYVIDPEKARRIMPSGLPIIKIKECCENIENTPSDNDVR